MSWTLDEGPGLSEPIAAWQAYLRRLGAEDQTDEVVQASIEHAESIIALKRAHEGDDRGGVHPPPKAGDRP